MKFFELAIGDRFTIDEDEYVKVKEEKLTCCKIKLNAKKMTNGVHDVVIKPLQDVVKVQEQDQGTEEQSAEQ